MGLRVVYARKHRILHPAGRSFTAELQVWGTGDAPTGSALIDRPGRYAATVRISKGGGTPAGWPDVLGLAVRVHGPGPGEKRDLLLSTAGTGRVSRHLPAVRRSFATRYGSILAYRTGTSAKFQLAAEPDPDGVPLGRTLASVVGAAGRDGAPFLLSVDDGTTLRPFGRVTLHEMLSRAADADLAFDPVRNTTADLHPTGLIHASRASAYRLGQRWRRARPAPPDPAAVMRTAAHR